MIKELKGLYYNLFVTIAIAGVTFFGVSPVYGQGGRILEYPEVEPSQKAFVEYMCHLQDFGDTNFYKQPLSCGTEHESRRLEGFMIRLGQGSENVGLRYMAHLQDMGDTGWKHLNEYVGTKGQGRRLEGFAIKVTGDAASKYDVYYMAHLQGSGDTGWYRNGQFCGSKGEGRRVEAIAIFLADKNAPPSERR